MITEIWRDLYRHNFVLRVPRVSSKVSYRRHWISGCLRLSKVRALVVVNEGTGTLNCIGETWISPPPLSIGSDKYLEIRLTWLDAFSCTYILLFKVTYIIVSCDLYKFIVLYFFVYNIFTLSVSYLVICLHQRSVEFTCYMCAFTTESVGEKSQYREIYFWHLATLCVCYTSTFPNIYTLILVLYNGVAYFLRLFKKIICKMSS